VLIFLDFDGVLRRKQSPLYRLDVDCLHVFENAVRMLPGAPNVITSSWRCAFSRRGTPRLFSADFSERIVGVTPTEWSREDQYRYREVLSFLKRNGHISSRWIALDDEAFHYPPGFDNLVLVDGSRGFDAEAAERLLIRTANPVSRRNSQ